MPTRRFANRPNPAPAPSPDPPKRVHGVNKPVRPPNAPPTRNPREPVLPPPTARARGGESRDLARPATTEAGRVAPTRIKVRAIRQGYYDHIRRHEGDVFFIASDQDFSNRWMEVVDARTPERITSSPELLRRQHDELLAERMPARGTPLVHDEPDADKNPLGA